MARKKYTDTELLEALQKAANEGGCPGLINDDGGRWAVSESGFQPVPGKRPKTMTTTFFVVKGQWKNSVREAIIYWIEHEE